MSDDSDKALRDTVRNAWPPSPGTPTFAATMRAAADRRGTGRRHYAAIAAVAATVAAVAIVLGVRTPEHDTYIEVAELLDSTYWTAPSDALLPDRQFDIYQDMPVIFESTEPAGGTLL